MIDKRRIMIGALSSVAQIVVAALGLFVLYRYLLDSIGPSDLGVWSIVVATSSLVQMANFGLAGSVTKQVGEFDAVGDQNGIVRSVETAAVSMGVFCLLIIAATYPVAKWYLGFAVQGFRLELATQILPAAMAAFWLMMVGSIYQGALFGCHMVVSRNLILIAETVVYLLMSIWVTPRAGLVGLVWARLLQNLITLALSIVVLRRRVPGLRLVASRWDSGLFRSAFSYAASFQFISLLVFVCDPLTKGFLSRYGSIGMVGYYEMANKLVLQFRSLLVGSSQVLVPVFVKLNRTDSAKLASVFEASYQVLFFLSIVVFGFAMAAAPLISVLWIGRLEPAFVLPVMVLSLGWCINSFGLPAYHSGMGTGELRPNVYSHVSMASLNLVLGVALGHYFEGVGVIFGWGIALAAGGLCTTWLYLPVARRRVPNLIPESGISLAIGAIIAIAVSVGSYQMAGGLVAPTGIVGTWWKGDANWISGSGAVLIFVLMMTLLTARHPVRKQLLDAVVALLIKRSSRN